MTKTKKDSKYILVMIIYLAGIFMGAIDTGIVTPARTVIQNNLGVNDQTGIWMITIYTLAYAVSIPIMGKLADKYGRKYIYLTSILLFGIGSLFCGLSQDLGSFNLLLIARVVQALGGGGILPVATAEFGTTFPEEKRGLALGLVGGVYGIANIFGASAGSAILDIFGTNNWQFIFYINIPITIFILVAGFTTLKNTKVPDTSKIDFSGIFILTIMILSLLYSLKNLDFFNISSTITNTDVLPFLIIFLVLIPLFIFIEKKAEDPVMNLNYFTDKNIVLTLLISMLTGVIIMGMIFVPQFCENTMKIATGSGGYFVIILGVFAGVGAPVSGKLIDKFGAKLILGFGFLISIVGSLFLSIVATSHPSTLTVVISLILIGVGVGFTMGTPLNYMMLSHTKESESNSALATLSLVRSLGTAVAPAIMVGFIAHAGSNIQDEIMKDLPNTITIPKLPYADEITKEFNDLKSNSQMKDKLKNMDMPDLTSMETVKIDFDDNNSDYKVPDDVVELMKTSDVTTITNNSKIMAKTMFDEMTPSVIKDIQNNVQKGIDGVDKGVVSIENSISKLNDGYNKLSTAYTKVNAGYNKLNSAYTQVNSAYIKMNESYIKANNAMKLAMKNLDNKQANMNNTTYNPSKNYVEASTLSTKTTKNNSNNSHGDNRDIADNSSHNMSQMGGNTASMAAKLKSMKAQVDTMKTKVNTMKSQVDTMKIQATNMKSQLESMKTALTSMKETLSSMKSLEDKMIILQKSVPNAFDEGEKSYLKEIDNRSDQIENTFQKNLNIGFKNVYLTTGIASIIGLLLLLFYKNKPVINNKKSS
ncbi:MFS transporter [Terrisporobacter petrolearius]|uniref:MFS transporter n=1 Tax=Terrisporobacter petrolearius TaxID=1460447 RepID=UPI0022E198A9|nr:MFS transporter [Terrisporobacter petrolearius]